MFDTSKLYAFVEDILFADNEWILFNHENRYASAHPEMSKKEIHDRFLEYQQIVEYDCGLPCRIRYVPIEQVTE